MVFEQNAALFSVVIFLMIFDAHRQLFLLYLIMCAAALGIDGVAAGAFYWVFLRPLFLAIEAIGSWADGRIKSKSWRRKR